MEKQDSILVNLVLWLIAGAFIGYFSWTIHQSRVDWPVAFSAESDFDEVELYPHNARITRDWSQFGDEGVGRPSQEYRYAVWLDVDYNFAGRSYRSSIKYCHRMSDCGAESNAAEAMKPTSWPIKAYANRNNPEILTPSLYYADRAAEVHLKIGLTVFAGLAWLCAPIIYLGKRIAAR